MVVVVVVGGTHGRVSTGGSVGAVGGGVGAGVVGAAVVVVLVVVVGANVVVVVVVVESAPSGVEPAAAAPPNHRPGAPISNAAITAVAAGENRLADDMSYGTMGHRGLAPTAGQVIGRRRAGLDVSFTGGPVGGRAHR